MGENFGLPSINLLVGDSLKHSNSGGGRGPGKKVMAKFPISLQSWGGLGFSVQLEARVP